MLLTKSDNDLIIWSDIYKQYKQLLVEITDPKNDYNQDIKNIKALKTALIEMYKIYLSQTNIDLNLRKKIIKTINQLQIGYGQVLNRVKKSYPPKKQKKIITSKRISFYNVVIPWLGYDLVEQVQKLDKESKYYAKYYVNTSRTSCYLLITNKTKNITVTFRWSDHNQITTKNGSNKIKTSGTKNYDKADFNYKLIWPPLKLIFPNNLLECINQKLKVLEKQKSKQWWID